MKISFAAKLACYALSLFLVIRGSDFLSFGAFALPSWYAEFTLGAALAAVAMICSFFVGAPFVMLFGVKTPGVVMRTAVGTVGTALALLAASSVLPACVLLSGFGACLAWAFCSNLLVWLFGLVSGSVNETNWLPTFKN